MELSAGNILSLALKSIVDAAPVVDILCKFSANYISLRDEAFISKLQVLLEEISVLPPQSIGFVVDNLRQEHGEDYFNEALFNAVEKSDSKARVQFIGRLIVLSSKSEELKKRFWEVLNVLQSALFDDLKKMTLLLELQARKYHETHSDKTVNGFTFDQNDEEVDASTIRDEIGHFCLIRLQGLGLVRPDFDDSDGYDEEVDVELVEFVKECMKVCT